MSKFKAVLDSQDWAGSLYLEAVGNTKEQALSKMKSLLAAHVGGVDMYMEDVVVTEEIST
jgi:hypothetical protein